MVVICKGPCYTYTPNFSAIQHVTVEKSPKNYLLRVGTESECCTVRKSRDQLWFYIYFLCQMMYKQYSIIRFLKLVQLVQGAGGGGGVEVFLPAPSPGGATLATALYIPSLRQCLSVGGGGGGGTPGERGVQWECCVPV